MRFSFLVKSWLLGPMRKPSSPAPKQQENYESDVERQAPEEPKRQKYSGPELDKAWASGYADGRSELLATEIIVPSRSLVSIPQEIDAKEYWYLLGWEAGLRSAVDALGV